MSQSLLTKDGFRATAGLLHSSEQWIISALSSTWFASAIICLGVVTRTAQYLFNRSLWIDEATLVLNIVNRSFSGLLMPLNDNQAAPLGFLMIERAAVQVLGDGELVLRLFPFLCGIASLFLFYELARRCLDPAAAAIALTFFAAADNLIYFSSEVKQYSSDVMTAVLILLLAVKIHSRELNAKRLALFGAVGAMAVWISHPSVFVLAGAGTTLLAIALRRKDWPRFARVAVVAAFWGLSFTASYLLSVRDLGGNQELEQSWLRKGTFMPMPPRSLSDLRWFVNAFFGMFTSQVDTPFPHIAALLFLVACISVVAKKKARLVMVISPIFFALLASGLHKYPFGRRLLLFLVPSLLIFIAEGVHCIINLKRPYSTLAGLTLAGALLFLPTVSAGYKVLHPRTREEARPVLSYVSTRRQPGDVIYLYYDAAQAFEYYKKRFGMGDDDYVVGVSAREDWKHEENDSYLSDLSKLRGKRRVWLIFSHIRSVKGVNEERYFLEHLDRMGKKLDEVKHAGASAYLYDLK